MTDEAEQSGYVLSPSQGVRLMALAEMLRAGDLQFRGDEPDEAESAADVIADVAQEIALQTAAGNG
jgi:hypothetical protein